MNRKRWIAATLLAGLGFVGGCGHYDCGGSWWSRLCARTRTVTAGEGPCCEGPMVEDPGCCAGPGGSRPPGPGYPAPLPAPGPGYTVPFPAPVMPPAGQTTLPPLATPPRIPPQAQPFPADPTAATRIR